MAPEVISQNKFSEKADVYSFGNLYVMKKIIDILIGVLLCELYTGETPYADSNLFPEQVKIFKKYISIYII